MKPSRIVTPLFGSIALLVPASAVDFIKLQNTNALNVVGAWTNNAIPGTADVLVWDATYTAPGAIGTLSQLGGDLSVLGVRVANVGGAANAGATLVGFQNASSANTLTIGASGINMSAATQALRMDSKITIGANQAWAIANANTNGSPAGFNNGEDLSFQANAAAAAFSLGGNTVTTSGAGQITITSGYTIDNGTFNVGNNLFVVQGGGSRVTNVNSNVNFNVAGGSTLLFQSNSGAGGASFASSATVNLNGGTLRLVANNATLTNTVNGILNVSAPSTLNVGNNFGGGSQAGPITLNANLTGSAALSLTHTASTTNANGLVLAGNNSGYSGTITIGGTAGRIIRLNTATAGSAAATWSVGTGLIIQTNGVSVDLGTLNGAGTVNNFVGASVISVGAGNFSGVLANGTGTLGLNKVGTGTLTLSGANTYTDPTNVIAGTVLTTPAQTGATSIVVADGATFGVNLASASTTFNTSSLAVGTVTGGAVQFGVGALGNPVAPLINATSFNPVAGTAFKVTGSSLTAANNIPLLSYSGAIGGGGFAGLSLSLPFRVTGNLVDNVASSRVDMNITGTVVPAWRGTVNSDWDVDSVGNGSAGTANWFAPGGPNTYVQGAPVGTDSALFDDTVGAGPTSINLTTTLTPVGVTVNNSAVSYTFSGSGKISGSTGITKSGSSALTIANVTANDYTGATTINTGTLRVGNGVAGAGSLGSGPVVNNGSLVLDRPDDFSVAGATSGAGSIAKNGAGTVTFSSAVTSSGAIDINGGKLRFTGGGNLSGSTGGSGQLEAAGGTLQLSGPNANFYTGLTTVSGGLLQLNKTAGITAVNGDITISGTGQLALLAQNQISDSATINFIGSSTDSIPTQAGGETVANVIVNSSVGGSAGGQVIMRNGFNIAGTATVNSGILGVGSGQVASVNAINITGTGTTAIVRIAGNSAASTLNVGAGGITASGGDIQVKFNTNDQDAILNLGGNFAATGNVTFSNAGYPGLNLNQINLLGTRTFDIAAGTATTVTPDIAGSGDLIKLGGGTLSLEALNSSTHTGATVVGGGALLVKGSIVGTSALSVQGGILAGNGSITLAPSAGAEVLAGAKVSPGDGAGTLTLGVSLGGGFDISGAVAADASGALLFDLSTPVASDKIAFAGGALSIGAGTLEFDDFVFSVLGGFADGNTYTLIDGSNPIAGSLGPDTSGLVGGFPASIQISDGGNDLVLVVPEPGSAALLLGGLAMFAARRRRS